MSVKVRLKMKGCHFIYEILTKQDFYLFQFKIAEPVSQLPKKTLKKIEYADIRRKDILIESTNKYPNLLDIYHRDMEYRNCIGKILIDDDTFDRILYNLSEENIS